MSSKAETLKNPETPRLNLRQRKYLKEKILGKNSRQAALAAGYSEHVANTTAASLDSKPAVQAAFRELLQKAGLTDTLLARRIREGVNATDTRFFPSLAESKDDIPYREVIDYQTRHTYCELAAKIKQVLPDRVDDAQREAVQVVIQVLGTANVTAGHTAETLPSSVEVSDRPVGDGEREP